MEIETTEIQTEINNDFVAPEPNENTEVEKPKRGRPSKKAEQGQPLTGNGNPLNEIDSMMGEYKEAFQVNEETQGIQDTEKKRGRPKKGFEKNIIKDDPIITGSLLIILIDLVIPNIMVFANNKFSKKKIKTSDLMLSNEQKKELEPFADAAANQMMLKGNPIYMLIVCLLGMYGVKLMTLKAE
jgi:hypothetical protein